MDVSDCDAVRGVARAGAGFSTRPVTIITPSAAGNSPDVLTRIVADRLTALWKQQIVVLNRPGAGGMLAAQPRQMWRRTATRST